MPEINADFVAKKLLGSKKNLDIYYRYPFYGARWGEWRDSDQQPMLGANILLKDTNMGTSTDNDGRFVLEDVAPKLRLGVRYNVEFGKS